MIFLLYLFVRWWRAALAFLVLIVGGRAQTIYITTGNQIFAHDSSTGAYLPGSSTAGGLPAIIHMTSGGGLIYATQYLNGNVGVYHASNGATVTQTLLPGSISSPTGIAFDGANNRLYVASSNQSTVGVYHATTGAAINATLVPFTSNPSDVWLGSNGWLYVTNGANRISTFDAFTGALLNANFVTGLSNPLGVVIDEANGRLYVTSWVTGVVGVYDATTGATIDASFISGLTNPRDLALDGLGHLFVTSYGSGYGIVSRYNATTAALEVAELAIFSNINAIAFAPVPEPVAYAVGLGSGAGAFCLWRRRRLQTVVRRA